MRSLFSCLCFVLLLPSSTMPQSGGRGRPPGIATADTMANAPLEAPSKGGLRQTIIGCFAAADRPGVQRADAEGFRGKPQMN